MGSRFSAGVDAGAAGFPELVSPGPACGGCARRRSAGCARRGGAGRVGQRDAGGDTPPPRRSLLTASPPRTAPPLDCGTPVSEPASSVAGMLSTPDSFNSPHDDYLGPWNLHRCDPRHPVIANISTEPAELVRTTYRSRAGGGGGGGPSGVDRVALWGTVAPDEEFNLCLCDEPAVHTVEVTLAWFGPESPFEQSWSFDTSSANDQPWSGSPC